MAAHCPVGLYDLLAQQTVKGTLPSISLLASAAWPAVVQRMVSDAGGGEWEVEFAEDKVDSNRVRSRGSKDD